VRDRLYFILMGVCVVSVILAWTVVRLYSVTPAVAISAVALVIPPIAVIIANAGDESSRRRLRVVRVRRDYGMAADVLERCLVELTAYG